MNYSNSIIYNFFGYIFKEGSLGRLTATSNTNKVFFKVGIPMTDPATQEKKLELYNLFVEDDGRYILTGTSQRFKIPVTKDNFSSLEEWQQRVVADFISKIIDV